MKISIQKHDLLLIQHNTKHTSYYGASQDWYKRTWHKKAGCGPTCAANITLYLSQTNSKFKNFYTNKTISIKEIIPHMDKLYSYITPGPMGVNNIEKFTIGLSKFAKDLKIEINTHIFNLDNYPIKKRKIEDILEFLRNGLLLDSPIAFLNLSRGKETHLQSWHWIMITGIEFINGKLYATASDEGNKIVFDLGLWYLTSNKHGGFVYIT